MRSSMKMVTVAAVALLATGCNLIKGKETAGQSVDDATIATRAKAALVKDATVSATDFNIDVYKGNVTLTGVAKNSDEVVRAIDDIKRVPGVVSVKNAARVATADRANKSE
jgi:hyperosmotically inducible protein